MPKDPIKTTSENVPTKSQPNFEEEIRHRAYELYEERGREEGHDLDDWLQAEAEITGTAKTAAA